MANKLTKGKRKHLMDLVLNAAYLDRTVLERRARIQGQARAIVNTKHSHHYNSLY